MEALHRNVAAHIQIIVVVHRGVQGHLERDLTRPRNYLLLLLEQHAKLRHWCIYTILGHATLKLLLSLN